MEDDSYTPETFGGEGLNVHAYSMYGQDPGTENVALLRVEVYPFEKNDKLEAEIAEAMKNAAVVVLRKYGIINDDPPIQVL